MTLKSDVHVPAGAWSLKQVSPPASRTRLPSGGAPAARREAGEPYPPNPPAPAPAGPHSRRKLLAVAFAAILAVALLSGCTGVPGAGSGATPAAAGGPETQARELRETVPPTTPTAETPAVPTAATPPPAASPAPAGPARFDVSGTDPAGDALPESNWTFKIAPDELAKADILSVKTQLVDEYIVATLGLAGPYDGEATLTVNFDTNGDYKSDYGLTKLSKRPELFRFSPGGQAANFITVTATGVGTKEVAFKIPVAEFKGDIKSFNVQAKAAYIKGRGTDWAPNSASNASAGALGWYSARAAPAPQAAPAAPAATPAPVPTPAPTAGAAQTAAQAPGELKGTVTLSGAWALYPLAVRWGEEFEKLHPGVKVEVSAGGAGKGMADALGGLVDIGMVSRPIDKSELDKGAYPIGVTKDAVVATVNAKNPVLDGLLAKGVAKQTFTDIYITGNATTWGEVAGWPNADKIHVYTRSDAAGAPEIWANYLGKKQENLKGTGVYGDPGLLAAVQKDPLGIGFNNIGYAFDLKTGQPVDGIRVVPFDVDGDRAVLKPFEDISTLPKTVAAIQNGTFPHPPARVEYFVTKGKPTGLAAEFIRWTLTDGQKFVGEAGYVELSPEVLADGLKKVG